MKRISKSRFVRVAKHRNVWIGLASGAIYVGLSAVSSPLAVAHPSAVGDLAGTSLTLAGFGFSVSLAALALVLALPQNTMLRNMMLNSTEGLPVRSRVENGSIRAWITRKSAEEAREYLALSDSPSLYSNLVFLYLWTGGAQIFAAFAAFVAQAFAGESFVFSHDDIRGLVLSAVLIASSVYAMLQLVTALIAIGEVAKNQEIYLRASIQWISSPGNESREDRTAAERGPDRSDGAAEPRP